MHRRRLAFVVAAAAAVGLGVGAFALAGKFDSPSPVHVPGSQNFQAELTGFQETPAVSTNAVGEFRARLSDDGTTLHYVFTYTGLEGGNSLFAHVHFGERAQAGGVSFFLCGGSTKPAPCPNGSGTVEGDVSAADVIGPTGQGIDPGQFDEIVRAMELGQAYANIHTTRWPAGEIRGQINNEDQREFER